MGVLMLLNCACDMTGKKTKFTAYTYLSVPMLMHHLDIEYEMITEKWTGEYQFYGTRIWDSARSLNATCTIQEPCNV
jgi:hypothetical protein